jgi:adenine phosphoribosyltransferase
MFHEKINDGQKKVIHERIRSKIRTVPNWPKNGVMFRDITTLLQDAPTFNHTIELLKERYKNDEIDIVIGIESRGFIIGSALAHALGKGFVPIRKKGKLPHETESQEYSLEYGTDIIEIHKDAIKPNNQVLLVDDLIATGGTALAACQLVNKLGGQIKECCFIIDLPELGGRKRLEENGYMVFSLVEFEGE